MFYLPRFLLLTGFLAALMGCQASAPMPVAKMTSASAPATISPAPGPKSKDPSGLLYNDEIVIRQSPRKEQGQATGEAVEFLCFPTGNFNLSPTSDDHLLFQTICVERYPVEKVATPLVKDTIAYKVPGAQYTFNVNFWHTWVTVEDLGQGKRQVRLHYPDANGETLHVPLPELTGKEYHYSFASLTPDTIEPISEVRRMKVER